MDSDSGSNSRAHAWIRSNILGFVAIFIALSGSAIAANVASQHPGAHAAKKKVKRGPPGPQGPQGATGAPGAPGAPGTARGYGHWFGGTNVQDTANSLNVNIADASLTQGEYCIDAVGFTPKSIQVTIDQTGQTVLPNRVADAGLGGYGNCASILPGTDAFVRTHLTNDDFVDAGFFVVLN
jgi:hypothetical protein